MGMTVLHHRLLPPFVLWRISFTRNATIRATNSYGDSVKNYVATFPVHTNNLDCKTVQEMILIGDPSLMIGGYGP